MELWRRHLWVAWLFKQLDKNCVRSSILTSQQHRSRVLDVALECFQKFRTDCTIYNPVVTAQCG
ncbi:hypothetical protein MCP1_6560001 [Candidatus Terasakiella magnetica]|nr:hypothetical protein MCP1_6560001 [Candidatus Terasakiella magnetica]